MSPEKKKPVAYAQVKLSEDNNDNKQIELPSQSLTWNDFPSVVASFACFISFIVYGACAGSLGASLPALAVHFQQTESKFGLAYTARGLGYFFGTIGSAAVLEMPTSLKHHKSVFVCVAVIIIGLFTALIPMTDNFHFVLMLIWLQGFGFGMNDTFANCLLPELWGTRVSPWMQAMHCCFGIGAIIGPAMVGLLRFKTTFTILGISSISPSIIMFIRQLSKKGSNPALPTSSATDVEAINDDSSAAASPPLIAPILVRILLTIFFFIYVGAETSFGAWITAYALNIGVTSSERHAAYLASYFWASLAFGRLVAIVIAIYVSNTRMLRFQLTLCMIGGILMLMFTSSSFYGAVMVAVVYGFALSSIFPLVMTLLTDYGYIMDSRTTTMFVVGSTCGEAMVPIIIGIAIDKIGLDMLPISICSCSAILVALYIISHMQALRHKSTITKSAVQPDTGEFEMIKSLSRVSTSTSDWTEFDDDSDDNDGF